MSRPIIVVIAGFPRDMYDRLATRLNSLDDRGVSAIGSPTPHASKAGQVYSESYVGTLAERCRAKLAEIESDFSLVVIYAALKGQDHSMIIESFASIAAFIKIKCDARRSYRRDAEINRTCSQAVQGVQKTIKFLNVLYDHLNSRANKTPLLLPLRNFASDALLEFIREVGSIGPGANDPDGTLKDFCERFEKAHPRVSRSANGTPCFKDDKGVLFCAPGRARHGRAWNHYEKPHMVYCYLAARVRLGSSYHRGFHYDCSLSEGRISGRFTNCHDGLEVVSGATHVNIAPNDFVRWQD